MAQLLSPLKQRFFDSNGAPLVGGKLYSYAAGTSTPLATYVDFAGVTENPNPTILDASGECDVWIGNNFYKFVLADANDIVQFTVDNVSDLGDLSILERHISAGAVSTTKLADGAATTPKIADLGVTTGKLADGAVTNAKLASESVSTAKIVDGAVTRSKMGPVGAQVSALNASYSNSTINYTAVPNLSVTITTTGRPVVLMIVCSGTGVHAFEMFVYANTFIASGSYRYKRGATVISEHSFRHGGATGATTFQGAIAPIAHLDVVAAGTYTYTVEGRATNGTSGETFGILNAKLIAFEL